VACKVTRLVAVFREVEGLDQRAEDLLLPARSTSTTGTRCPRPVQTGRTSLPHSVQIGHTSLPRPLRKGKGRGRDVGPDEHRSRAGLVKPLACSSVPERSESQKSNHACLSERMSGTLRPRPPASLKVLLMKLRGRERDSCVTRQSRADQQCAQQIDQQRMQQR